MSFKVWNERTDRIVDRSIVRPADGPNINLRACGGEPIRSNKEEPPNITSKKFSNEDPQYGEPDYIEGVTPYPYWDDKVKRDKQDKGESLVHDPCVRVNKDGTIDVMQLDDSGNPMLDSMGDPTYIPRIKPTDIAGKTFLLEDEDGDKLRFTCLLYTSPSPRD